jgi:hypothetical protein
MAITRRALLISNPGELGQENYCKGVYVDIKNYQRLMLAPEGGAWDASDIKHLDRPSASDVRSWLEVYSKYDYMLVMFTGHGWYSSNDGDRILELRKGEQLASSDMAKGAKKRTIILDCCQKVHPESLMEKRAADSMASAAAHKVADPARCRELFLGMV